MSGKENVWEKLTWCWKIWLGGRPGWKMWTRSWKLERRMSRMMMVDEETRCRCFSRSFLPTAGRRCFSRSVSADKALEGWLMVTKKLLLEMMDIFMFKEKKVGRVQ